MHFNRNFSVSISSALKEALEGDIDDLIRASELLKDDKTTTVAKLDIAGTSIIIKRYNARNFRHRIKRALRQSRAMRCWLMSEKFRAAGLQVAPRVAMIEKRFGPFCLDAYFITKWVDAEELLTWLPKQITEEKERARQQVNLVFKAFKQHRLSHGDMKATNLLWKDNRIVFLDLDAATQHESLTLWVRGNRRDKKRLAKNGVDFKELLSDF